MTSDVLPADAVASAAGNAHKPHLEQRPGRLTAFVFFAVLATGLLFSAYGLMQDVDDVGSAITTWTPFLLLGVALLIALGFEFVNGFHDTANAVATVIYTHSRRRRTSRWSGRVASTFSAYCSPAARWPSASSPCCRWN